MSDFSDQGAVPGQGAVSAGAPSAGALIRRAREDAGVHIAALSVALKVPVKRLEALEADRHDLLPDAVFVRALASSVCRSLRLDPAQVLPLLPQTQVQPPTVEGRINEPFRPDSPGASAWPQVSRPAVIAAAVLALAALAVYLVPRLTGGSGEPAAPVATEPVAAPPVPATAPAQVIEAVPPAQIAPPPAPAAPATLPAAPAPAPLPAAVPSPAPR